MNLLIIDKSEENCQIIEAAISEDGRTRAKEDEKVEKISRSCERIPKDVGSKDKGDTHSGRDIGNNTTEVKRKCEDHRCRHIHWTDSEICTVAIGNDS